MKNWITVVCIAASLFLTGTAHAQYTKNPRDGVVLGLGIGGGVPVQAGCSGCDSKFAVGMGFQMGYMLSPTLGIMFDGHGTASAVNTINATTIGSAIEVIGFFTAAAQWWVLERLWLKAGIGMARSLNARSNVFALPAAAVDNGEYGFAATAAVGYEVYRADKFALDLRMRMSGAHFKSGDRSNLVGGLGFTWFI